MNFNLFKHRPQISMVDCQQFFRHIGKMLKGSRRLTNVDRQKFKNLIKILKKLNFLILFILIIYDLLESNSENQKLPPVDFSGR